VSPAGAGSRAAARAGRAGPAGRAGRAGGAGLAGRAAAGLALLVALVIGVLLVLASATTPGHGLENYLSELGVRGAPRAGLYRLVVLGAALGVALLAGSLRRVAPPAALALLAAAPLFGTSALVTCSPGCPLPPHGAGVTWRDLVHAGASGLALAAAAGAMLLVAAAVVDPVLRTVSVLCAVPTVAGIAVTGGMLLLRAHSVAGGLAERVTVAGALTWLVSASALMALRRVA